MRMPPLANTPALVELAEFIQSSPMKYELSNWTFTDRNNMLAEMAGEHMRLNGAGKALFVCTHPHRGKSLRADFIVLNVVTLRFFTGGQRV